MRYYCYGCQKTHDESAFHRKNSRTAKRPVQGWCKKCMTEYGKKYRALWKRKRAKARRGIE